MKVGRTHARLNVPMHMMKSHHGHAPNMGPPYGPYHVCYAFIILMQVWIVGPPLGPAMCANHPNSII